jgi:opacity protein-like surface antigen
LLYSRFLRLLSATISSGPHKVAGALFFCLSFGSSSSARAADAAPVNQSTGFYATLGLGASETRDVHAGKKINLEFNNQQYELNPSMILHPSPGFTAEAGVGYDFGLLRTELTYLYNNAIFNDSTGRVYLRDSLNNDSIILNKRVKFNGSADINSIFLSTYLDIPIGNRFVPYIGGGIGPSQINVSSFPKKHDDYNLLGYQAKIGITYLASCTTDLFLEGTYKGTSASDLNRVDYSATSNWGTRIGARLRFANRCGSRPISTPTAITKSPAIDPITE